MKNIIFIVLLSISAQATANGFYLFTGAFAYDDGNVNGTAPDYKGLSPNGFYGIKYIHVIDNAISIETGLKHESSMPYRETGGGFNGFFFTVNLKIF